MTEEPVIIQMHIAHYREILKLDLDNEKRSIVERLLAEAKRDLAVARDSRKLQGCWAAGRESAARAPSTRNKF